jgi:hypothetical protein
LRFPRRKTAERYGVSVRTIERWEDDPELDFPKSTIVNGRRYDNVDELDAWDAKCAAAGRITRTPPAARPRHGQPAADIKRRIPRPDSIVDSSSATAPGRDSEAAQNGPGVMSGRPDDQPTSIR